MIFIFLINLFLFECSNIDFYRTRTNFANITLRIKGNQEQNLFNINFNKSNYPYEIRINGINQNIIKYSYYFNNTDNYVELIWNHNKINCNNMFKSCSSIYEINFPNFDTSQVETMENMFYYCKSLTSLNLSNFDTSNVQDMSYMFTNCELITSLNLTNFNISKVVNMDEMFDNCTNILYINLISFFDIKLKTYRCIFNKVPDNIYVCGNETLIQSQFKHENKKCSIIDCSDDWQQKQKRIINNSSKTCIDTCENDDIYKYEYNGKCFQNCSNGYYTYNNITYCKCELEKCLNCTPIALKLNLCNKCNYNYYPKENDESNYGEYINCYEEINGYYLDKNNSIFKRCFGTCETCEIEGNSENHNCLKCNSDFPFKINISNYYNCYVNCSHYYFENKNFSCNIDITCPNEYPMLLLEEKKECLKNSINLITNIEENEKPNKKREEEIKYYDLFLNMSETIFTSDNYNTSKIDKGEEEITNIDKVKIIFRTTQSSKNNTSNNITKIDLGECETLLRNHYNISNDEFIYLKQTEIEQEGMNTKKVEYDVYSRLSQSNLIKLNLSLCEDTKITLSIPIIISESLDKLNISSGYYNDICYTAESDSGTDITLNDRKKEYKKGNNIICQEDCDFSSYDYNIHEAICSCNVKESSSSFANMKINKEKIYEKFIDINNIANIKIMICYKILFSKNGIIHNIPFYSIIILIIFHFVAIFIFYYNNNNKLKEKIKDILFSINNWKLVRVYKKEKRKIKRDKKKFELENIINERKNINLNNIQTQNIEIRTKRVNKSIIQNSFDYNLSDKLMNKKNPPIKSKRKTNVNINNNMASDTLSRNIIAISLNKNEIIERVREIMAKNDEEMNNLSYKLALKLDKRTYCEYYLSLIKTKHFLIFTFYNNKNEYNSQIIKIDLFFIGFITDFFMNALFFNDDTMHKIYEEKGNFNFINQLPQIIYSTLLSIALNTFIQMLALSEDNILDLKRIKRKKNLNERVNKLYKLLRIKFILYFIISFLLLIFFWYYLSMFCAIYKNTQNHLIKDTLISFGLSLVYPFVIYLFPGIFRVTALSDKKNKRNLVYNLSLILQML